MLFTDLKREHCSQNEGVTIMNGTTAPDAVPRPRAFTRRVFNPLVGWLTKVGLSVKGSRILEVRGRTSGELRTTVVNLLTVDGVRYLVAPRGETSGCATCAPQGAARCASAGAPRRSPPRSWPTT